MSTVQEPTGMQRITITVPVVKHDGRVYRQGDTITVDDALARYFIECGWAIGQPGNSEERRVGPVTLDVQSAVHQSTTKEI